MRRSLRGPALGLVALALVSTLLVGSPATALEPDRTSGVVVHRVRIVDFRFRPRALTIERGDVVRWRNNGDVSHTSTSADALWDSGTLAPGETFRRRFRRRGTFDYQCTIHPSMTAAITVV